MGRKIPGKKHRGVKDPYEQHTRRFESIKNKINKAPSNPDEQPIPKSLLRLMNWKNEKKNTVTKPTLSVIKKRKDLHVKKPKNPVSDLKKIPGESNKSFNMRINEAMKSLMTEKTFDDINNDMLKEDDDMKNKSDRLVHKKRKKNKEDGEPRLTKSQKKTLKTKMKKEKFREEKELENRCAVKRDFVAFGDIVHAPPMLNIKPRKAQLADTVPRPARKDLLLNKLFDSNKLVQHTKKNLLPNIKIFPEKETSSVDLKGKRKNLPMSVRSKLEETQKEAIEAYKLIKLAKINKKKA